LTPKTTIIKAPQVYKCCREQPLGEQLNVGTEKDIAPLKEKVVALIFV